jgi:membrane-associated phospholipid phosphatase
MLRRPGPPLLLATLTAIALAITGVLAKLVPLTRAGDQQTLNGFVDLNAPHRTPALNAIAHLADPGSYALVALVLAAIALARGRARVAAAIPVIFIVAGATTEALKHLLATQRFDEWLGQAQIGAASWPSGHSTAAMTMALCAVLAAPPRLRPTIAAIGGTFAVAVAYAILTLGWHFPSDVFGGYLVAATYVLLAISAIAFSERRWPSRRGAEAGSRPVDIVPALGIALIGAGAAVGVALARPQALMDFVGAHTTSVAGGLAIAALAAVLAGVIGSGFRAPPRPW